MISKQEYTKRFAKKLQAVRKRKNMSQEELADRAGVYRTYIGHLENGRYSPSGYILYKITSALGVDPKEFISL